MPNWALGRFTRSAAVRLIGVLVLLAVLLAGPFVRLHAQDVDLLGSAERQTAQTTPSELALPLRDLMMRASPGPPRSPVPRGGSK